MLALLKNILTSSHSEIEPRVRVNRVNTLVGPERVDGLVINVTQGLAYVAWPNGDTTVGNTKHLVPIIAWLRPAFAPTTVPRERGTAKGRSRCAQQTSQRPDRASSFESHPRRKPQREGGSKDEQHQYQEQDQKIFQHRPRHVLDVGLRNGAGSEQPQANRG